MQRFRALEQPVAAINSYLEAVQQEAARRSYHFDARKIGESRFDGPILESIGQLEFEWLHLKAKLEVRSPAWLARFADIDVPEPHPSFCVVAGPIQSWERVAS